MTTTPEPSANVQMQNLLRECQEYLPMSWHDCDDSECSNDLCERHRGHAYVSKRIDAIADLDGRIDDALAGHITTDSGFREFGIILAEIEKAYEAMGAPRCDQDPDARDPAYIGAAVRRYIADARFRDAETDTLAELQAERQSNAALRDERAALQSCLARLSAAEARAEEYEKAQSLMDEAEWEALKVLRDAGVNSLVAVALPLADGIRQVVKERDSAVETLRFIADQPCEQRAEGSSDEMNCTETGACVTEFCLPCHARAHLSATRATTKQEPQP